MTEPVHQGERSDPLITVDWIRQPGQIYDAVYQGDLVARVCPDEFGWLWEVYANGHVHDCGVIHSPRGCRALRNGIELRQAFKQINRTIRCAF